MIVRVSSVCVTPQSQVTSGIDQDRTTREVTRVRDAPYP